jgi:molecular chaperone GrpE
MARTEGDTPEQAVESDGEQATEGQTAAHADRSASDLVAELAAAEDRLLRALAEQENMRRRARREREEALRYASADFAGDLLASIDNLERAIASVPDDQRSEAAMAGLLSGVEATRRALLDAFARHGLERLDPLGERFDPHRHEAGFEVADTDYPPGVVAHVMRPGYRYRDRLLRPALVGVSKGPEAVMDEPAE